MSRLKKERSLLELLTGILLSGVIFGLFGLIFLFVWKEVSILKYECSVWLGIFLSIILAILMWRSLNKAFLLGESDAVKVMVGSYMARYLLTGVFLFSLYFFGAGYILAGFLGIMSIKTGAYMQPLLHRFYNYLFHEQDPIPQPLVEEDEKEVVEIKSEEVKV